MDPAELSKKLETAMGLLEEIRSMLPAPEPVEEPGAEPTPAVATPSPSSDPDRSSRKAAAAALLRKTL